MFAALIGIQHADFIRASGRIHRAQRTHDNAIEVTHVASIFHRFDRLITIRDGRIEGEEPATSA